MTDFTEYPPGRKAAETLVFELGRAGWKQGIHLSVGATSPHEARAILTEAIEASATDARPALRCDPGWWAIRIGTVAHAAGLDASIDRIPMRGRPHVVVLVDSERMSRVPCFPLARFGPTGCWWDLRSELALATGPADRELEDYRSKFLCPTTPLGQIRAMFDAGVLEFNPGDASNGLRGIRAVGR